MVPMLSIIQVGSVPLDREEFEFSARPVAWRNTEYSGRTGPLVSLVMKVYYRGYRLLIVVIHGPLPLRLLEPLWRPSTNLVQPYKIR